MMTGVDDLFPHEDRQAERFEQRNGGVMGFGGVAVSAAEMDALGDMVKALGLKS